MLSNNQNTIQHAVYCTGVGVHSNKFITMTLKPSNVPNSGVVIRRTDLTGNNIIKATYNNVSDTQLGTTVTNQYGTSVSTIEHLMAALWGSNIDNIVIEVDGPEIPIMDGSSNNFMFLLECAGIKSMSVKRNNIRILKSVSIAVDEDKYIQIDPADNLSIDMSINFNNKVIGQQQY